MNMKNNIINFENTKIKKETNNLLNLKHVAVKQYNLSNNRYLAN